MNQISETAKNTAIEKLNSLLQEVQDPAVAVLIFQAIDMLCDAHRIEMPEEAISANIGLDDHFGCDVLRMR